MCTIERIGKEIARLDNILKQFLHALRPQDSVREKVQLHNILRDTLETLEAELIERDVKVNLELVENLFYSEGRIVRPGQSFRLRLTIKNSGKVPVQNVSFDFLSIQHVLEQFKRVSSFGKFCYIINVKPCDLLRS